MQQNIMLLEKNKKQKKKEHNRKINVVHHLSIEYKRALYMTRSH